MADYFGPRLLELPQQNFSQVRACGPPSWPPRRTSIYRYLSSYYTDVSQAKTLQVYDSKAMSLSLLLGPGLLGTLGHQHKRQRKMLNPVFSVKHLREMTPIFYDVIHRTRDAVMQRVIDSGHKNGIELDMLSWSGRTTLEVLGQAGLGVSFDPLTEDRPNAFADAVKDFFPQLSRLVALRGIISIAVKIGSRAFRRWVVERMPFDNVQQLKCIADTLHNRSVEIFNERKAALESGDEAIKHQIGEGRDIMSILVRENMRASESDKLPDEELIAQGSTTVLAGMDTTANSLARVLRLLADHPQIQDKLRQEIIQAVESEGEGGTLEFDKVMALPYLEAICRETVRYPGVTALFRTKKDMVLPLSEPIRMRDGTMVDAIPIPKGTEVLPNVIAANCNPALWGPDASEWRPERWLEPIPRAVEEAHIPGVYSHLMTFIGGNKSCIGFKFAQIEFKMVLLILLQHFEFRPTGKKIFWNFGLL
ncbi:cytochrome P450 [Ganoderma sinense ZZ0214-1]|uniref:Cytochrome P450 n=1 Tax=Ganoderma sinense ZZ0214-1 TaxID=1077348 RepID=A0A2G8SKF3_9APHY|nr:cytochrome P450 [Ganoderma sinense ZZ0214-1]